MRRTEENPFQSIPSKRHRLRDGVDHALKSEQVAEMVLIGPTEGTYVDICMSKFTESIPGPAVITNLNKLDTNVIGVIIVVYDVFRSLFELQFA